MSIVTDRIQDDHGLSLRESPIRVHCCEAVTREGDNELLSIDHLR